MLNIFCIATDILANVINKETKFRPIKSTLIALTGFCILSSACSDTESAASNNSEPVTLYSERSKDLIQPIIDQYETETGNKVEVRYGDDGELVALLNEEGDKTPADVFLSKTPGAIGVLEQNDHLTEISENTLSLVEETVKDKEGLWVGISGRQRVLVYNTDLLTVDELPETIFELTEPEWKGKLGLAPNNGSFRDFVTAMRTSIGEEKTAEWLAGIAANEPETYPKNGPIIDAVGIGEVEVGLVNHYYNFRELEENPEHKGANHQFPASDPGSFLMISAATKLKATDNTDAADELIKWLLGEDAQRYFADETFEYPLANGVAPAANIPDAQFSDVSDIDYQALGDDLATTQQMISDAGLRE